MIGCVLVPFLFVYLVYFVVEIRIYESDCTLNFRKQLGDKAVNGRRDHSTWR